MLNVINLLNSHLNDIKININFISIKNIILKVFACF